MSPQIKGRPLEVDLHHYQSYIQIKNTSSILLALLLLNGGDGGGPIYISPKNIVYAQEAAGSGSRVPHSRLKDKYIPVEATLIKNGVGGRVICTLDNYRRVEYGY